MSKFLQLAMAFLAMYVALVGSAAAQTLSARDAHVKASSGDVVLVDIRTPEEWRETGVATSAHAISMHQDPKAFVKALDTALGGDRSRSLALICRTGNRSGSLMPELKRLGYTNVIDVSEGMAGSRAGPGWLKTGLPIRTGASVRETPRVSIPTQATAK
jgi:rhodanese-related sulfurtransferase